MIPLDRVPPTPPTPAPVPAGSATPRPGEAIDLTVATGGRRTTSR